MFARTFYEQSGIFMAERARRAPSQRGAATLTTRTIAAALLTTAAMTPAAIADVTPFDFVTVGDPGNDPYLIGTQSRTLRRLCDQVLQNRLADVLRLGGV
jgi:hypothetical protein